MNVRGGELVLSAGSLPTVVYVIQRGSLLLEAGVPEGTPAFRPTSEESQAGPYDLVTFLKLLDSHDLSA